MRKRPSLLAKSAEQGRSDFIVHFFACEEKPLLVPMLFYRDREGFGVGRAGSGKEAENLAAAQIGDDAKFKINLKLKRFWISSAVPNS